MCNNVQIRRLFLFVFIICNIYISFMYTDIKLVPPPAPSFCPYTPAGPGSTTGGRASSVQTCCNDGPPISCGRRTF